MQKKRKFRFSQALKNAGISEARQHIIYGMTNDRNRSAMQDALIKSICRKVGGSRADGLYRFLTDNRIDHNYIYMNYGIRPNDLFEMKRRFYKEFQEQLNL